MFQKIFKETCKYYESKLKKFGSNARGVDWKDVFSQKLRFRVLAEIADLSGKKIHDIGCGCGHFFGYLKEQNIKCHYTGSDISYQMIQKAKESYPEGQFHTANILETEADWMKSDFITVSGLFYVKTGFTSKEWKDFVSEMLLKMFNFAREGISFNLMSSYVDYEEPHLFYCPPQEMFDFCVKNLARHVVIRHDYNLWEYSVYVYKKR